MDLRQLRYFVTVAEELHFGRAARRPAMTQPPLSQQIRALEEGDRSAAVPAHAAFGGADAGRPAMAAGGAARAGRCRGTARPAQRLARGELGSLALAFVSTADYGILPDLLRRFRARHPEVQLQLREATSDVQFEALAEGSIDAGPVIRPQMAALPAGLSYVPLMREPRCWRCPKAGAAGATARGEAPVSLREVADEPLIIFPRRSAPAFYDIITGCYAREGIHPAIAQEAIQMQTIVSLVSAGMGVALVPASLCNLRRTGVSYLPLHGDLPPIETGGVAREWRRHRSGAACFHRDRDLACHRRVARGWHKQRNDGARAAADPFHRPCQLPATILNPPC